MLGALRRTTILGLLVDQAFRGGVRSQFFGLPVSTTSSPASLAAHTRAALHPVTAVRHNGCRFIVTVHPELTLASTPDRAGRELETTLAIDAFLEAHIRQRPDQWLWLHNRWKRWLDHEAIMEQTAQRRAKQRAEQQAPTGPEQSQPSDQPEAAPPAP